MPDPQLTPEQMADKLRAVALGDSRVSSMLGGVHVAVVDLIEAADLIDRLAAKVEELELPRCGVCGVPEPRHMHGCDVWHREREHIERLAAEREHEEWRAEIALRPTTTDRPT